MEPVQLNLVAVALAAVAYFVLGGLWYSPVLFAKPFTRAIGKTDEELAESSSPILYVFAFLGGLVKSVVLAMLLGWVDVAGPGEGALLGVILGLGIHGSAAGINALFEGRSATLLAIGVGYDTIALAAAGAIIAAF